MAWLESWLADEGGGGGMVALWTAFCINPTFDTSQRSVDGDSSVTGAGRRPRATWAYIITVSSTWKFLIWKAFSLGENFKEKTLTDISKFVFGLTFRLLSCFHATTHAEQPAR